MALTKKWSVASYDGREAEEVYQVDEVESLAAARLYPGVPQLNTPYVGNPRLKSRQPHASKAGFGLYDVRITYGIPEAGEWEEIAPEPFGQPTTWWWEVGGVTEPIDYAFDGSNNRTVPIVNSSFDPIDPQLNEEFGTLFLHAEKTFSDMNLAQALQYQNSTNADAFSILGRYDVHVGQARCVGVFPVSEQTHASSSVRVRLTLEFRDDGFKRRILDQGFNGFNDTQSKMPFVDNEGNRYAGATRLNGEGKPLDPTVFVGGTTVNAPFKNDKPLSTHVTIETTDDAVWLLYKTKKSLDFAPLLAQFN